MPERTGVAPPLELAAVLAPRKAEATVLKAAPPSKMSLVRLLIPLYQSLLCELDLR